ncbi:MAG: hypothetical protein ACJATI_005536 [Halioglobus sp.]|jgi:hypothetical protein
MNCNEEVKQIVHITFVALISIFLAGCTEEKSQNQINYPKAYVSYSDYENIVKEVKPIRKLRLINYDQLIDLQKKENVILLDTRSKNKYQQKHLKGAINLPFTEFTQSNLRNLIPDIKTRIIIYCNNNFDGDSILFASKTFTPDQIGKLSLAMQKDSIMLALNIPTYINLHGYKYQNIYELNELINISDDRLKLEGSNLRILNTVESIEVR